MLLPEQAVKMFTAGENADKVISGFLSNDDIRRRVHVMQLYASSDSLLLQSMLKRSIYLEALNYTSTREEDLSFNDRITFEYILSGFISLIGQQETRDNYAAIMSFQNTEFGSHCREALCRILHI